VDDGALKAVLAELDELIGLREVRAQVHRLTDFLRIQVLREQRGRKTTAISYHLQLIGPPGTGKTTVARLLARIYSALGILGSDKLVEATRSDMVAGYVGQTAPKTNAVIDSALDGMLFIDEAYSLGRSESGQDFGAEAIAELVKRMEDDRGRLVVVVAGYSREMEEFLSANSGLRERFAERLDFPDYSPDELVQIFERFAATNDYALTDAAKPVLRETVQALFDARDAQFANARAMRNLFEDTIKAQATRLADHEASAQISDAELTAIEPDDVTQAAASSAA
jgi:SpoVK/Ycf46/Vps4 family AAA+-type ATPase